MPNQQRETLENIRQKYSCFFMNWDIWAVLIFKHFKNCWNVPIYHFNSNEALNNRNARFSCVKNKLLKVGIRFFCKVLLGVLLYCFTSLLLILCYHAASTWCDSCERELFTSWYDFNFICSTGADWKLGICTNFYLIFIINWRCGKNISRFVLNTLTS